MSKITILNPGGRVRVDLCQGFSLSSCFGWGVLRSVDLALRLSSCASSRARHPTVGSFLADSGIDREHSIVEAGDSTTIRGLQNVGRSPPCAQYEQLVLISELDGLVDLLDGHSESEGDIKHIQDQFASMKMPLLDLIAKCKRASSDLLAARKACGKQAGKRESKAGGTISAGLANLVCGVLCN